MRAPPILTAPAKGRPSSFAPDGLTSVERQARLDVDPLSVPRVRHDVVARHRHGDGTAPLGEEVLRHAAVRFTRVHSDGRDEEARGDPSGESRYGDAVGRRELSI